jgi:hypothetical protein
LKGEEFYDLEAGHVNRNKIVHWIADETVKHYLEEDFNFFDGLEHNVKKSIPLKIKKNLKNHFKSLDEEYGEPRSFQLNVLHPYLSYLESPLNDNDNQSSFGFADTQFAISNAFLYDTIPFMKTMERMTNPYFQDAQFASVMRSKRFIGGSESENDEVSNLLLNDSGPKSHLPQPVQNSPPAEKKSTQDSIGSTEANPRRSSRKRVKRVLFNMPRPKKKKKDWYAPENHNSPPVVDSSIVFPIKVEREKLNCAYGNTVNLLTYINHFNTALKRTLLISQAQSKGCPLREIRKCMMICGYDTLTLPSISSYSCLQNFVTELGIPVLVSLELKFGSFTCNHVIGISPFISSETSQLEYHIIDGAHPGEKAMIFNKENIDWCCGEALSFDKITYGFAFVPGRKRVLEMFNDDSGFHLIPGTAVCLTSISDIMKKDNNICEQTYERMLSLNVSKKGKSEYVKIWKKLMEEFKSNKM